MGHVPGVIVVVVAVWLRFTCTQTPGLKVKANYEKFFTLYKIICTEAESRTVECKLSVHQV